MKSSTLSLFVGILAVAVVGLTGCESTRSLDPQSSDADGTQLSVSAPIRTERLSAAPRPAVATASSPRSSLTSTFSASRSPRRADSEWKLVRWTSVVGVERRTSMISYEALLSGVLSAGEVASASRLRDSGALSFGWAKSPESDNAAAGSPPPPLPTAIELEAAQFPELIRTRKFIQEGDRLVVTGPGLLRFEFVRHDSRSSRSAE